MFYRTLDPQTKIASVPNEVRPLGDFRRFWPLGQNRNEPNRPWSAKRTTGPRRSPFFFVAREAGRRRFSAKKVKLPTIPM